MNPDAGEDADGYLVDLDAETDAPYHDGAAHDADAS